MADLMPLSFDGLRAWEGSQARAFEELTYQLLKDSAPAGSPAIRTGNPDGGVEWYSTLPNGTEYGWQAKYVRDIDSLLTGMTNSVQRVCLERPQLVKLTFVISSDLATGTSGRSRVSQREKYEKKIESWRQSIPGANRIEFELIGKSGLVDLLSQSKHRGRVFFWWNQTAIGPEWLGGKYEAQVLAASDKYRPDLQVDIPIQDDLLALGFDTSVFTQFDQRRHHLLSRLEDLHLGTAPGTTLEAHYGAIGTTTSALQIASEEVIADIRGLGPQLGELKSQISQWQETIWQAVREEELLRDAWKKLDKDDPARASEPLRRAQDWGVRHVILAVDDLETWLYSSVGKAWISSAYFLTGQAGSGKTHLFLDATLKALEAGRPAVFLPGAAFQPGGLWASITDQLGLGNVGADELLGAMDSAAEASSITGSRFVIFIDALNETRIDDFWLEQLPSLRAAIAPYPHIALAVSCRDTYVDVVLSDAEATQYVRRDHPGFAGSEIEATQRYFDHYGLEAPKIPLLVPEFSIPLFLRMYCESLVGAERVEATGHQGRVVIFERYLAAKLNTVARRFRTGPASTYELRQTESTVKSVVDRLVDEIALLGREGLTADRAEAVVSGLVSGLAQSTRLLGILQDEGILTNERLYLTGGSTVSGVRIVFQAFSDYLILSRRLGDAESPEPEFVAWLRDESSWGVREAATIVLPERFGVELIDLLCRDLANAGVDDDSEQPEVGNDYFDDQLHRYLVETLPYRAAGAISQRTINLLNEAQRVLQREDFYRALFILAPIPDSRLNGAKTFDYLARFSMPQRDADFGKATFYELSDSASPAARLARWAAAGPYEGYDPLVVEMAAIPLCWLMSSSNRYMRDWVTKALVQLLRGHLDVMERLVRRFWAVNDPYVVQRVVVIAYGALLRADHSQSDAGGKLAKTIIELVFARPVRPDELMLDAARGIVRHAAKIGQLTADEALPAWPPYGLTVPGSPPTRKNLEDKYGWKDGQSAAESYSTVEGSIFGLGDFGRYVVESGVHNFSRYRIGAEYPPRQTRERRTVKPVWKKFLASLTDEQEAALTKAVEDDSVVSLGYGASGLELSPEQRELLSASFAYSKIRDDQYPGERARRWVLRRTISLGWTPELFGETDRMVSRRSSGREGHKAERWGKKYQWMAYHELLARVADNFQTHRSWFDRDTYGGLHEIIGGREIDPTLPPVPFEAFDERRSEDTMAWLEPTITVAPWPMARLDFARYNGALESLLTDTGTEPTLESVLFVRETSPAPADDRWIVLNANTRQVDPKSPKRWRGLQQIISVNTVFARHNEAEKILQGLAGAHRKDAAFFGGGGAHTDCCYVAEVGRTGPACSGRAEKEEAVSIGDVDVQVVSTTENYLWESGLYDCSIENAARLTLPSTFIQAAVKLTFDPHGPSLIDGDGNTIFIYYDGGEAGSALLVRASFLHKFMSEQNLELVISAWFERRVIDGGSGRDVPWTEAWLDGRLDADLKVHPSPTRRLAGPQEEHAD